MKKLAALLLLAFSLAVHAADVPNVLDRYTATITGGTITGVTIDNTVIGGTTAAAGTFTTVKVGNGSVGAPAIAPSTGATNTGIFFDGSNSITRFAAGGVLQGQYNSGGFSFRGGISLGSAADATDISISRSGANALTLSSTGAGSLTLTNIVTPATTGTRYLCISTLGVVTSSASACSGT